MDKTLRKVFLDTETTGLAPGQIGQLSMIIEHDDNSIEAKNYFFEIDYITDSAKEACGRDIDFYREASKGKRFKDYANELLEILSDSILIAHKESFDENFLSAEFWRQDIIFKPAGRLCTMTYFMNLLKITPGKYGYKYKPPRLSEVVDYFNIDEQKIRQYSIQLFGNNDNTNNGFHDARYDTTAMFIIVNVYRDILHGTDSWKTQFQKG